jgi:flagellin-like hook-associated protein FlgL
MSDITLSAGIRQNLLSLQQTSADLTTTQEQLATGKKVNTAFDNPTSYFTSQSLTNRANDLSALLDQIGQAQQTLNAANDGLTGLTSLLEQALSTAQQAQQATTGTVTYSAAGLTGSTPIAADTTKATATATFSTAASNAGVTASTQSNVVLTTTGLGDLTANNGHVLTFKLGSGSTFTATVNTNGDTASTNQFDSLAGLASILNADFGTAAATAAVNAGSLTLTAADLTDSFTVGGNGSVDAGAQLTTTAANLVANSELNIGNGSATETFYYVGANGYSTSSNLAFTSLASLESAVNSSISNIHGTITATDDGSNHLVLNSAGTVNVDGEFGVALGLASSPSSNTTYDLNYNSTLAGLANGSTLTVQVGSNTAHTLTFGTGNITTKAALTTALSGFSDITAGYDGSGDLQFTPTSASTVTIGGTAGTVTGLGLTTGPQTPTATVTTPSSTRATLQTNYNNLLTQIDQLAGDSSYNGVNLLGGDNLTVNFNENGTSGLTIAGVNFNSAGLGLSAISGTGFQDNTAISTTETAINNAITNVRAQTETFGTNSSTISTRQTFETNLINTLQTGASNLVLADQNQASANLLTEQTQQQLEISALSIANEANQSVLKLFG